jgi:hypothetical protein
VKTEKFEDILNSCFDRISKGGTVEDCLDRYPDQARELEPLLKTFAAARIAAQVNPRAEFKTQARYQFQVALAEMAEEKRRDASRGWRWRWQSAWSMAGMAILIVIVAGAGTVAASGNSMPDNALYPVKRAAERAQLALTPSDLGKAELNAKLADKRVEEIGYMADKGNGQEVQILAQSLNTNMQNIVHLAGADGSNQERAASGTSAGTSNPSSKNSGSSDNTQGVLGAATPSGFPAPSPAQAPQTSRPPVLPAATVPATTPPPTTAAPVMTITATAAPPAAISLAPAPTGQSAAANSSPSTNFGASSNNQSPPANQMNAGGESEKIKIARLLVENTSANIAKLTESLSKASPDVRPAIRQAIAQAQVEYDKALVILQDLLNQSP